jgi:recombination protein RecA
VRVKVVKNKVAAPFRQAEFDIEFGKGISTEGCLIDLGLEHKIVAKSGSFFSYGDERLGQGRNNAKTYLVEHPEMAREIEERIYAAAGVGASLAEAIVNGPPSIDAEGDAIEGGEDDVIDFEREAAAITIADERAA